MTPVETLFTELCADMDKFTALMDRDDFLGTAEERDLDARINAQALAIAVTPAMTKADASVKLAALSRRAHGMVHDAQDIMMVDETEAALIAGYLKDVRALAA